MKNTLILAMLFLGSSVYAGDAPEKEAGFMPLQDANNAPVDGWEKSVTIEKNGYMGGGGRYMKRQFGDFILRFDFRLSPGSNSGIGIRCNKAGNMAYAGMEIQVLDNTAKQYDNKLQEYQYHGSIYGVVPAKRGHLKPVGEWNTEEIRAEGDHIKVTLNGVVIVDAKLSEAAKDGKTMDKNKHPGLFNKTGYLGIAGHGGGVAFRNMRIKPLDEK